MNNKNKSEQLMEELLSHLGEKGVLLDTLSDQQIDDLINLNSEIYGSSTFKERALYRMSNAQKKRAGSAPLAQLGNLFKAARLKRSLSLEQVSQLLKVEASHIEALEEGNLLISQIVHNFNALKMLSLLQLLSIQIEEFVNTILESVSAKSTHPGFTETQAAFRKHTSDNLDSTAEITEYIAEIKSIDRQS